MVNEKLFNQLKEIVNSDITEPTILVEQPSPYVDETIRLIYMPKEECFLIGPNAQVEPVEEPKLIYPSYLRNVAEVLRGIFESEDVWLEYVSNLWTAHSLNAHFVSDLDASYQVFASLQAIIRSENNVEEVNKFPDNSTLEYFKDGCILRHVSENGDVLSETSIEDPVEDMMLVKFLGFWEKINDKYVQDHLVNRQREAMEAAVAEGEVEEHESEASTEEKNKA